jgi:outer membrane receptor protein involved in Fe transport
MTRFYRYFSFLFILLCIVPVFISQTLINGKIIDKETGEDLIGASVKILNSKYGTVSDFNGEFKLQTNIPPPFEVEVSYIGYSSKNLTITNQNFIKVSLQSLDLQLDAVEVLGGLSEKLKESPLSIEAMNINDIKETSATNFYEGLSHMKGVDLTSASLGFRVINTRGFNSTSPVRTLQIIDGVDNASPGLNFALGNFLGASELDLMKVEIISGASSAFYGPNAFNGVISMETKDPFLFPGFSSSVKLGERFLNEYAVRYAKVIKNKEGKDRFALKFNVFYMSADDWVADNGASVADLETNENNPGGYDAINRYGDENLNPTLNQMIYGLNGEADTASIMAYPGLERWHRKGYWEQDLVDYNTENLKTSFGMHYLFDNSMQLYSSSNFSTGTTVYQGDNRFSLKNIRFFQNKIELKKDNDFFIRLYATHENAGDSYDAVLTAFQLQNAAASDVDFHELYKTYWRDNISTKVEALDSSVNWEPAFINGVAYPVNFENIFNVIDNIPIDSLNIWHQETTNYANGSHPNMGVLPSFEVGTERFDSLLNKITSTASVLDGGSKIIDKSALYHGHGEKIFDSEFAKWTVGSNFRLYTPKSEGSLFSDTNGVTITNWEVGGYIGIEKSFLRDQLIIKGSLRLDKNQNFSLIPTQALSGIYNINENHTIRSTFTSAIRNPTLLNQYMYYNVGRAKLVGNKDGYQNLYTLESIWAYATSGRNIDSLVSFDVAPIRPEEVKCIEFGYRGVFENKIYVDANYYYNWYQNFIGFVTGAEFFYDLQSWEILDVYRVATNSSKTITTQGLSLGVNYYLDNKYTFNGNFSWNKLNKQVDDPIIPAYNTPEFKFNIGLSGKDIDIELNEKPLLKDIGFNFNYKWVQGFLFEGSPQFTGEVPTYGLLDFQMTKNMKKQNLAIKIGASNILNNRILQVYGGPFIGRMAYISLLFDFKD